MRAAYLKTCDGIDAIQLGELEAPKPSTKEVLIEIHAAGVNPVDWKIAEGLLQGRMEHRFPLILGWDVAGIIVEVGSDVKEYQKGDPIFAYARQNVIEKGTYAEYIALPLQNLAIKPKKLTFEEAASIPLSALTAWQSLDQLHLKKGDTIFIHAGAGGVGGYAIQFAKLRGCVVITTASSSNFDYVKALGADKIIDYKKENFVNKVSEWYPEGVDAVFDTIGVKESYEILKKKGRLATIAVPVDENLAKKLDVEAHYVFVSPHHEQLKKMATLIDEGKVKAPKIELFELEVVKKALHKSKEGHTQGKLVIKIK